MQRLEHLDKHMVDELARAAREAVRDELREQTRGQRRRAVLYAGAGAAALYAGAAVSLAVGLVLDLVLPGWAAALITAVALGMLSYALRGAARPATSGTVPAQATASSGGRSVPVPPTPSVPPTVGVVPPRPESDPDTPRRRA
ncbi:phage holin family protein [Streptomyces pimonensis]|uniref:Phage holin family protein n=1 Tax=Streptomyces pimonensis TaxID=2860288 RepID=A0ABV4J246_9ACTN